MSLNIRLLLVARLCCMLSAPWPTIAQSQVSTASITFSEIELVSFFHKITWKSRGSIVHAPSIEAFYDRGGGKQIELTVSPEGAISLLSKLGGTLEEGPRGMIQQGIEYDLWIEGFMRESGRSFVRVSVAVSGEPKPLEAHLVCCESDWDAPIESVRIFYGGESDVVASDPQLKGNCPIHNVPCTPN